MLLGWQSFSGCRLAQQLHFSVLIHSLNFLLNYHLPPTPLASKPSLCTSSATFWTLHLQLWGRSDLIYSFICIFTRTHCLLLISTPCIPDATTFQSHSFKTFVTIFLHSPPPPTPAQNFRFIPAQNCHSSPMPILPY